MTSYVEEQIRGRIAAAKEKRQQRRQQRAELDAARIPGLAARHDAKMRRWAEEDDAGMGQSPTAATPGRGVTDLRSPDGHAAVTETVTVADSTVAPQATTADEEE